MYITAANALVCSGDDVQSILLIDDFETHLELMTAILEQEGFRVIATSDQQGALGRIDELAPDLAVLDVMMPGMNGYDLCKALKAHYGKKFFPVILVTGLAQIEDKITGLEAGADDFFSKPFNPKEIVAKIRSLLRLKRLQDELDHTEDMIFTLAMAVEAKDFYTRGHSERVSALSADVARFMGLPDKDIVNVRKGGILHDIGKIGVHEDVLHKTEALSKDELEIIRRHPHIGAEICKPLRSLRNILPGIRFHHERWDGAGFPDGLGREDIPLMGRIISVVDSFDAMVSRRPYREGRSVEDVIGVMKDERNSGQWDPAIVAKFLELASSSADLVHNLYGAKA